MAFASHAVPVAKDVLIGDLISASPVAADRPSAQSRSVAPGLRSPRGRQARTDALCFPLRALVRLHHFDQRKSTDSRFSLLPEISLRTAKKRNHSQDSCRWFSGPVWVGFNTDHQLTHRANRSIQLTAEREHYATLTASVPFFM